MGTAALFLLGTALGVRRTRLRQAPKRGLVLLSPEDYAVLCAVADRICPALGNGAPGALALGVPERIDAILAEAPAHVRRDVKSLLFIVENALVGALFLERARPFTQLSAAEQDTALSAMRRRRSCRTPRACRARSRA
ncbi:MAG TPA: gluconate 2-dehydrogenase subunit 3 family protein [Polyangiales bacterium]